MGWSDAHLLGLWKVAARVLEAENTDCMQLFPDGISQQIVADRIEGAEKFHPPQINVNEPLAVRCSVHVDAGDKLSSTADLRPGNAVVSAGLHDGQKVVGPGESKRAATTVHSCACLLLLHGG